MKGIPVHLRLENQASSPNKHLFDVPAGTELEDVATMIRAWGVTDGSDYLDVDQLYGQFRVSDGGPYFEFVLGEDA